jgi:excisionase family DNA binding protein
MELPMARTDGGSRLTPKEASDLFVDPIWASTFPPIITVDEAAALVRVPKQTVYAWSSQGLLKCCSFKAGKHLRILRNKFLQKLANGELYGS